MNINFNGLEETDLVKILFSEKVGVVLQSKENLTYSFDKYGVKAIKIGETIKQNILSIGKLQLSISSLRKTWMATSTKLELHQTKTSLAATRAENVIKQPLKFNFPNKFNGKRPSDKQDILKAAVIREKGSNSEREMAYMMDLSGFEVRDVHMTDLIEGRENLEDINLLVAVGGFSNSDVLGSAKGWAGAFKYNPKAKSAIENFFDRKDTLSLGVCNGCQLFVELGLITPNHIRKPKMLHNDSGKFECIFTAVAIEKSNAIMLNGLEGSILGIWAAHAEGKFSFPQDESNYQIPAKYLYQNYPSNPNGSDFNAAMLSSEDGRHLVMMPHLERSIFPWNWGHYPENHSDEISPWIMVFENAYNWIINKA
jgi:phosphoribosylformylglycinamidine synthase